jgi:hypothetical protein
MTMSGRPVGGPSTAGFRSHSDPVFYRASIMSKAIQQIVDAYVQLGNRRALEDLRMHRQRLAIDLKGRAGLDLSLPIRQIDEEIAVVEGGLREVRPCSAHERR